MLIWPGKRLIDERALFARDAPSMRLRLIVLFSHLIAFVFRREENGEQNEDAAQ